MTEDHLTPYQGNLKCYGFFECTKCKNKWTSKHSWANTSQKCKYCLGNIYPHRQLPMEIGFSKKQVSVTAHNSKLCGKCEELGELCTSKRRTKSRHSSKKK